MSKKHILMILVLVIALVAAGVCLAFSGIFTPQEAPKQATNTEYSTAATNEAIKNSLISQNEILLAETVMKLSDGNVLVRFQIYSVAEGYDRGQFLDLTIPQAQQSPGLSQVGTASCQFLKGNTASIFDMNVFHDR